MGNHLEDQNCYLLLEGLQTLRIRADVHQENGLIIAKYLEKHPLVTKVDHPLLEQHAGYQIMKNQTTGFTGMFTCYFDADIDQCAEFMSKLKLFKFATSLGGTESLLDHFASTMRYYYNKE